MLKNRILGAVGVLWGLYMIISYAFGFSKVSFNDPHSLGMHTSIVLGIMLLLVGLHFAVTGGSKKKKMPAVPASALQAPIATGNTATADENSVLPDKPVPDWVVRMDK